MNGTHRALRSPEPGHDAGIFRAGRSGAGQRAGTIGGLDAGS